MTTPTTEPTTPDALPPVDVVIATHNRPELLRVALDAVLSQTYRGQIRVTLVFDHTDIDHSLVRNDGDRIVTAVNNTRSRGLAGARNTGILEGTAPLVAFCDDDDEWMPDKVALQVRALTGSASLTSVTGIIVSYADHQVVRIPRAADMTLEQLVRDRVMAAHPSTVMVRREALVGPIGLVDEGVPGSYGEDFDWIIRAARAGGFAVVEDALVTVLWGQSLFSQRWQTIVDAIDYLVAKHPEFRSDSRAMGRLHGRRAFALAALGRRQDALRCAAQAIRANPKERRAYLAAAVAVHLVSAERLMSIAHSRGHGI